MKAENTVDENGYIVPIKVDESLKCIVCERVHKNKIH